MVFGNPPEKTSSASHDHWGHHRDSNGALRRRQSSEPPAWSCNVAAAGWASSSVLSSYRQTSAIRWHFIQGLQAGNDLEAKQTSGAAPHGAAEKDAERLAQDRKNGKPLFFWFFWSALRTGKGHPLPLPEPWWRWRWWWPQKRRKHHGIWTETSFNLHWKHSCTFWKNILEFFF